MHADIAPSATRLVPLLAGENVTLTRPIFLDSHGEYAGMVFDDRDDAAMRFGILKSFGQVHRMKFERHGR